MAELESEIKEKLKLSEDEYVEFSDSDDDFHDLADDIKHFEGCTPFESLKTETNYRTNSENIEGVTKPNLSPNLNATDELDSNDEANTLQERRVKEEELLSCEEKQKRKIQAEEIKNEGNKWFSEKNYPEAIKCYSQSLQLCPLIYPRERSVYYSNRAACLLQEDKFKEAIQECTHALSADPSYVKAILRRAKAFEACDKLEEALKDYQNALNIDRGCGAAIEACQRLPSQIQERNERMKQEMFGKLKELGNMVLKPFGLSTENFKVNQDPNSGGYSINFQQNQQ